MGSYVNLLKSEVKKGTFNFIDFFKQLDQEGMLALLADIVMVNYENITSAFPASKGIYTDDLAFRAIRELPNDLYQEIQPLLENIFLSAMANPSPVNDKAIDNIMALTARRRQGLRVGFITGLIKREEVREDLKTDLAILLSRLDHTVPLSFWDREIDYTKQPALIPAFISVYKEEDPIKALGILHLVQHKPANYKYYIRPITTSLENILLKNKDLHAYIALRAKMPEWVKFEFDLILKSPLFEKERTQEDINSVVKQNKKEIRIGISLFPDLLLLSYAHTKGYFSEDTNYFYTIRIVDWNNIFDDLVDGKLDFIVANREVCADQNSMDDTFHFINPFVQYKGFSLVFSEVSAKRFNIRSFNFLKKAIGDEKEALKTAIRQLKQEPQIKIFASKYTDHYKSLIELLRIVGLTDSDVTILWDQEPHDGYELFANNKVDAIVGGLPQRLLALKNGGKELITQNDSKLLPFTQVNGLICLTLRSEELKGPSTKIMHVWSNKIASDFKEGKDKLENLSELIKLYNRTLHRVEPVYNPIDQKMFKSYWDDAFEVISSRKQINELPKERMQELTEKLILQFTNKKLGSNN